MKQMSKVNRVTLSKEKVYDLITERGKTPTELSKDFGYNTSYISNIFSAKHNGNTILTTALAIASMLNVSLDEIKADEPVEVEEVLTIANEESAFNIAEVVESVKDVANAIREFTEVYKELWGTNK